MFRTVRITRLYPGRKCKETVRRNAGRRGAHFLPELGKAPSTPEACTGKPFPKERIFLRLPYRPQAASCSCQPFLPYLPGARHTCTKDVIDWRPALPES